MTTPDPDLGPEARRPPWGALAGAAVVFSLFSAAALLGPDRLGLDGAAMAARWGEAAGEPWAPALGIGAFTVLALMGAPQVVTVAAMVAAFGPLGGFVYSWLGKIIACAAGFALGRRFGAGLVRRYAGPSTTRFMQALARRGFWASALIRIVPTVPSVMVNLAGGASPIRFIDFIAGAAVGSAPKLALIAFAGQAVIEGLKGDALTAAVGLGLVLVLWIGLGVLGRRWMR